MCQYWDSITKEDLEFSVGTKPGSWEVKDPLMAGMEEEHFDPISKRHSFYAGGNRSSFYETTTSLDYNPRPASSHNYIGSNTRLPSQPYSHLNEARQSYGDVRKSAAMISTSRLSSAPTGMYDEFDNSHQYQPPSSRDRSKGRPHNRVISSEAAYERY